MKIAVASGKGGTGKTTVALALAECAGAGVLLADCDVEEPNCHLFLDVAADSVENVTVPVPEFVSESCAGCGKCVEICRFHALARLGKRVLVFPELCHSCGGCVRICPEHALLEKPHVIGKLEFRHTDNFQLLSGIMKIGNSMAPPLIRAVKERLAEAKNVIFDAPPGTACPMVTTVRGCDYVILVTEPTPFGLHDLTLAVHTLSLLQIPCGIILNRAGGKSDHLIENYCRETSISILLKIPFSRPLAEGYAQGKRLLQVMPELRNEFQKIWERIGGAK